MRVSKFLPMSLIFVLLITSVKATIITVSGNLTLEDGTAVPIVKIELYAYPSNNLLGSSYTDDFGRFSLPNIDDLGGTLDAYFKSYTDSNVSRIGTSYIGPPNIYEYQSSILQDLSTTNNLFVISVNGSQNLKDAFTLQKYIYQPYRYLIKIFSYTAATVFVKFPASTTGFYDSLPLLRRIDIQNHADVIDTRTIRHEFGHHVMMERYGFLDYPEDGDRDPVTGQDENPEVAFKEGWGHAAYVIHNRTDDIEFDPFINNIRDYENKNWGHGVGLNIPDSGYLNEYEIAGIFLDLVDDTKSYDLDLNNDDDHIYNRDDMLWEILNEEPQNILDFYDDWTNNYGYVEYKNLQNEFYDIYFENNIAKGPSNHRISNDWAYFRTKLSREVFLWLLKKW